MNFNEESKIISEVIDLKRCLMCHVKLSEKPLVDDDGWAFCEVCWEKEKR